ncbi:MAG TPA: cyclopropane-fatty-acyl-phospholipid synthase family protein [Gemmataceae bacterium]|nr:cyclopropane-fatty-acyl-phospholipid synthase family protein [Gemmataceae bacterium]
MTMSATVSTDPAVQASFAFLGELLSKYGLRDFAIRAWDGSVWEADAGQPARFTLVLQHPGAVRKMFWPPRPYTLGEAYIYDDFDIEGDIHGFFAVASYLYDLRMSQSLGQKLRRLQRLLALPRGERPRRGRLAARLSGALHSVERDRQAVAYHYDVGNDFYQLWLDRRMIYTCAYFADANDDIDRAQERKLDYICRKLRLLPGDRLLDIGCGWGGLAMYAAQQYGVHALGITVSKQQVELAQERIRQAGLQDRCRVEFQDYREVSGTFDKLVSIGMFEQIGGEMLPVYFQKAYSLLRPGGVFLNHGISLSGWERKPRAEAFSQRYVFPDGELKPIHITLKAAEQARLEVRDVESLREHYTLTLKSWLQRLEARAEEARKLTNETTYRIWRLFMAGAVDGFRAARVNLYQTLLVRPDRGVSGLPLTRADWYT